MVIRPQRHYDTCAEPLYSHTSLSKDVAAFQTGVPGTAAFVDYVSAYSP